jgi:hypothetical protein
MLALEGLAHADADVPEPLAGPFKTAFDDTCNQARTELRGETGSAKVKCALEARGKQKPFQAVEVHKVTDADGFTERYYLTVETAAGWFVSDPVELVMQDGHAGSADYLTGVKLELRQLQLADAPALALVVTSRYRMDCHACEPQVRGVERWTVRTFQVVGLAKGVPTRSALHATERECTSELSRTGVLTETCDGEKRRQALTF